MHNRFIRMILVMVVWNIIVPAHTNGYLQPNAMKDPYISDILLHEIVNRMGSLTDGSESYMDALPVREIPAQFALMARATKDLESEQLDYDSLLHSDNANSHPSIRDQEYLQHSSLWGHQFITGGSEETGQQHLFKLQGKTDTSLPAYCTPPNPCPVGFAEDQGCQLDFENTAAFSRDYQAAQDCMCDGEHMFDCAGSKESKHSNRQLSSDLGSFIARQFQSGDGKGFIAKKFYNFRVLNPYLTGEKLPVAAKKGVYSFE